MTLNSTYYIHKKKGIVKQFLSSHMQPTLILFEKDYPTSSFLSMISVLGYRYFDYIFNITIILLICVELDVRNFEHDSINSTSF